MALKILDIKILLRRKHKIIIVTLWLSRREINMYIFK